MAALGFLQRLCIAAAFIGLMMRLADARAPIEILQGIPLVSLHTPLPSPVSRGVVIIKSRDLATYSSSFFFTRGNAVVMATPPDGATTPNSAHPRVEFCESYKIHWSFDMDRRRVMAFSGAVTKVGPGEQAVVIGQIKTETRNSPPLMLAFLRNATDVSPRIVAVIHDLDHEAPFQMLLDGNYTVGARYDIRISAGVHGMVHIRYNNNTIAYLYRQIWTLGVYYKAGNYLHSQAQGYASEVEMYSFNIYNETRLG